MNKYNDNSRLGQLKQPTNCLWEGRLDFIHFQDRDFSLRHHIVTGRLRAGIIEPEEFHY
jgi:hypothetical protein